MSRRRPSGDREWGRAATVHPPLPWWTPLVFWLAASAALVGLVIGIVRDPGPLDDAHQGAQRPGLLIDSDDARRVPALTLPGDPVGRRPVVVIFDRRVPPADKLEEFVSNVPNEFAVALVIPDSNAEARRLPACVRLVDGRDGRVAADVGMRRPVDGGAPVGYAVIDRKARVRYATLDPSYVEHGFELGIVADALR